MAEREKALGKALQDMFRALKNRPVPSRIRSVVDQLDDANRTPPQKQKRG